jgi:hypothetical protein
LLNGWLEGRVDVIREETQMLRGFRVMDFTIILLPDLFDFAADVEQRILLNLRKISSRLLGVLASSYRRLFVI